MPALGDFVFRTRLLGCGVLGCSQINERLDLVRVQVANGNSIARLDQVSSIKQALPGIGILVLSVFADCLEASVDAGAEGCLTKDCEPEELFSELRRIAAVAGDNR